MSKITVVPTGSPAGRRCYNFLKPELRKAWKKLTDTNSASQEKLQLLALFGVAIDFGGDTPPPPKDAVQEPR